VPSTGRLGNRVLDPEARLQHARDLAWQALNRRDRTVHELRGLLADRQVEPAAIEQVVGELVAQRYLDDSSFASRFAEDRRRLDDWGPDRIERRLRGLGVAPEHIEAALGERDAGQELDAAVALLERRFSQPPRDRRERDRMLGVLVRKGYDPELALDAIRRHARADEGF
jgi:regulatory protein